jgi:alpha-tubulin suppressor-like RCC1 family protein
MGYGNWQKSITTTTIKSDLNGVASAMENARTFGSNGYPTDINSLTTFKPSDGITLVGGSSDGTTYCVTATSSKDVTLSYYISSATASQGAQIGSCVTSAPTITVGTITSSSISLSWTAVTGATSYTLQSDTTPLFTSATTIATQTGTTFTSNGLLQATMYYYRVEAINSINNSVWSSAAIATTNIDAPTMTTVVANTSVSTTTWSWSPVTTCATGTTANYHYDYFIDGVSQSPSGWKTPTDSTATSIAFTTITEGHTYAVSVQADCVGSYVTSGWSGSGSVGYHRPGTWLQVSGGSYHTCAIASNSQAYCWGYNSYGELGNNSTTNTSVPVVVNNSGVLSGKTVKSIAVGSYHTCAIASDNQTYCWGWNVHGELGNNSTTNTSVPVAVNTSGVLSGKTIKSIATAAQGHTCAIASDNQAYCWGMNDAGELGNNSTTDSSIPVAVYTGGVLSGKTIKSIATGDAHTCAIASDNQTYCWGYNAYGQLGNNSTTNTSVPVAVNTSGVLSGKTVIAITAGSGGVFTCAIASDNNAYCWGLNQYGQLGANYISPNFSSIPVAVYAIGVLSGKTIISITSGDEHTCTIASDNQVYCWGYNFTGQLGNGSYINSSVPITALSPY